MQALEEIAPFRFAADWDNVGLMVGSSSKQVNRALVSLDITEQTVGRAIQQQCDLIIAHHPLIFPNLTSVNTDTASGRIIKKLIQADITAYALHTNLDAAIGGVNDALANQLELRNVSVLSKQSAGHLLKLAVFVPTSYVENVRQAITAAGAGHIGNYSHCTFKVDGTGTFLPLEGSNPFIGNPGHLEYCNECRLETILPESIKDKVLAAMLAAHPYEEVAYDLVPLLNSGTPIGLGRIGNLPQVMSSTEFSRYVKDKLKVDCVKIAGQANNIQRVAVCGGSGASLIPQAAALGADVFVTGEISYHQAQQALDLKLCVVDAGHFSTEVCVLEYLREYLSEFGQAHDWSVEFIVDSEARDIFSFV